MRPGLNEGGPPMHYRQWVSRLLKRNPSMRALGRTLGVADTSVLAWREGRSVPMPDLVPRLAALSEVSEDELGEILAAERILRATSRRRRRASQTVARGRLDVAEALRQTSTEAGRVAASLEEEARRAAVARSRLTAA